MISLLVGLIVASVGTVQLTLFGAQLKSFMSTRPIKSAFEPNGLSGKVKDGAESEILLPPADIGYRIPADRRFPEPV